jgi:hypothetical protein
MLGLLFAITALLVDPGHNFTFPLQTLSHTSIPTSQKESDAPIGTFLYALSIKYNSNTVPNSITTAVLDTAIEWNWIASPPTTIDISKYQYLTYTTSPFSEITLSDYTRNYRIAGLSGKDKVTATANSVDNTDTKTDISLDNVAFIGASYFEKVTAFAATVSPYPRIGLSLLNVGSFIRQCLSYAGTNSSMKLELRSSGGNMSFRSVKFNGTELDNAVTLNTTDKENWEIPIVKAKYDGFEFLKQTKTALIDTGIEWIEIPSGNIFIRCLQKSD